MNPGERWDGGRGCGRRSPAAAASGRTVYDAAITNTTIDEAKATFDPQLEVSDTIRRQDSIAAPLSVRLLT